MRLPQTEIPVCSRPSWGPLDPPFLQERGTNRIPELTAYITYAVSLWTEVPEVEGGERASAGPSSGLHHCLRSTLLKSCNKVATARTS